MSLRPRLSRVALWLVVHVSPRFRRRMARRRSLARGFLAGSGLEIGALHMPLRLPAGVVVRYVDYLTVPEQRRMYPELAWLPLAPVGLVDDGESLASVTDEVVDFVVANHVIEHCENPIGAIDSWLRVLRPGGVLFMAVPDQRHTFDRNRLLTTTAHVLRDYTEGPEVSRRAHWNEIAAATTGEAERETFIAERMAAGEHPHYHVWTDETFGELLAVCRGQLHLPFRLETLTRLGMEFVAVLRKV